VSLTLTCQAVLFDLDGVLVDSRAVVERTWERWARRHGIEHTNLVATAHGRRSIETVREVAPQLDAAVEVRWLESAELNDEEGLVALPGAAAALSTLPDRRQAIVTSGGHALAALRLRAAGLLTPSVLVAAEDVTRGKPAPDGYLLASSRLRVPPADCVVIEDTPPGIASGLNAGATVIALSTTFPATDLTTARVTVPSLQALRIVVDDGCLRIDIAGL
jgi:mannitol-1-/sugar-/sorbitol-6-phosphatase